MLAPDLSLLGAFLLAYVFCGLMLRSSFPGLRALGLCSKGAGADWGATGTGGRGITTGKDTGMDAMSTFSLDCSAGGSFTRTLSNGLDPVVLPRAPRVDKDLTSLALALTAAVLAGRGLLSRLEGRAFDSLGLSLLVLPSRASLSAGTSGTSGWASGNVVAPRPRVSTACTTGPGAGCVCSLVTEEVTSGSASVRACTCCCSCDLSTAAFK